MHAALRRRRCVPDVQRQNRGDHRQKRQAVEAEARHHAEGGEGRAGEERTDHAGQVELDRVERDRVRHVVLADERRQQRLIRGSAEGLRESGDDRQREHVPDAHDVPVDERGQRERGGHLNALRREQQPPPVVAIGDDAADQREQQDGQLAEKRIEAQEERRRGAGDREHQPALRDLLHPGADGRGEGPEPHHAEVAVGQRGGHAAESGWGRRGRDLRRRIQRDGNGDGTQQKPF